MSYFSFLAIFLGIPIVILAVLATYDHRKGRKRIVSLRSWPVITTIALHVLIAVAYTTPWDNYLVATGVWFYDPALVTGFTLGWVPVEEYTFFVLQPILGGLWLLAITHRLDALPNPDQEELRTPLRWQLVVVTAIIWLCAAVLLWSGRAGGTYLALELTWAIPPITLQLVFGADILWRHRRPILLAILPLTLYLSVADALAIESGTWTINPDQSVNFLIGGVLPLEEFIFFLLTNTLVVFGLVLAWSEVSHERLAQLTAVIKALLPGGQSLSPKIQASVSQRSDEIRASS